MLEQDSQIREEPQSSLPDIGKGTLMKYFLNCGCGTFGYQIIEVELRIGSEISNVYIGQERYYLGESKNEGRSLK
jgi:hypothetical protein